MIVTILSWCIFVMAFLQKDKARRKVALCYVTALAFSELFSVNITGQWYYIVCAFTATLVTFLLSFVTPFIKFTLNLQLICIVSILLNFFGWFIFRLGFSPILYNQAFIILYALTLMLFYDRNVVDKHRVDRRRITVPGYDHTRDIFLFKNKGTFQ